MFIIFRHRIDTSGTSGTPLEMRKFGTTALESTLVPNFVPDYSIRPVQDTTFLKIPRSMYIAAKQATVLERALVQSDTSAQNLVGDNFEEQINRVNRFESNVALFR